MNRGWKQFSFTEPTSKRDFLSVRVGARWGGVVLIIAALWAAAACAHPAIMEWKPGTYLFLDNALIESATNFLRLIERPARDLKGPIVTGKEDRCFQPYLTVLQDKRSGRFRMWY